MKRNRATEKLHTTYRLPLLGRKLEQSTASHYGATLATEKDYLHNSLHDYIGDSWFGNKQNVAFLNNFN